MNWAKWALLAFFVVGTMKAALNAKMAFQYGANRSGWESVASGALLAGLGVLVVLA